MPTSKWAEGVIERAKNPVAFLEEPEDRLKAVLGTYEYEAPPLRLNEQEFRFKAFGPPFNQIDISGLVVSADWRDEGSDESLNVIPVLRGSLTVTTPHFKDEQLPLEDGHRVRCYVKWGRNWFELWEMRINKPALQVADGSLTFELADDLMLAALNTGDFRYVQGEKGENAKKNGWRYDQIVKHVCDLYKIPLGKIVKGKRRIKKFNHTDISPLEAIRLAVAEEQKWTGNRYVISWTRTKGGRFGITVRPLRRNVLLYRLRDQIIQATVETIRDAQLATVVYASGSGKVTDEKKVKLTDGSDLDIDEKKTKREKFKLKEPVISRVGVKKYGWIEKQVRIPGEIGSLKELRRAAKRYLLDHMEATYTVQVTHPGIAWIRRGDAIELRLPVDDVTDQRIAFVVSVVHSVSAGSYTMDLTIGFKDPLDPKKIRQERDKAERLRKRENKKAKSEDREEQKDVTK